MSTTPHKYNLEAEYADGYIHSERELNDISPYFPDSRNVLNDILEKRPEDEHGPLVRLTMFTPTSQLDIDWTKVPKNARPIRFVDFERDFGPDGAWLDSGRAVRARFGYQYNDEAGKNVQEIEEIS